MMKKLANISNFESLIENQNGVNPVFNGNFSKVSSEISSDPMWKTIVKKGDPLSSSEFFRDMGSSSWRKKFGHLLRSTIDTSRDSTNDNQKGGPVRYPVQNKKLPKNHRKRYMSPYLSRINYILGIGDRADGWKEKLCQLFDISLMQLPELLAHLRLGAKGKDAKISDWFLRRVIGDHSTNDRIAQLVLKRLNKISAKDSQGIAFDSFNALLDDYFNNKKMSEDQFNQLLHDLYFKGSLYVPEDYDDPKFEIDRTMTPTLRDYVKNPKKVVLDDVDENELDLDAPGSLISKKLAAKDKKDDLDVREERIKALRRIYPYAPQSVLEEMAESPTLEITVS